MRNLFLLPIAISLLFSCSQSEEQSSHNQKNYRIVFEDTVRIDPKDELLFVANSLGTSDYVSSSDNVYNLNLRNYSIEVINISESEFIKRHQLEKEGPNGLGSSIRGFRMVSEEAFYVIQSNFFINKYSLDGKLLNQYDLREVPVFNGDSLLENERIVPSGEFFDGKFITLYAKGESEIGGFAILDFETKHLQKEQVNEFDKISELQFFMQTGSYRSLLGPDFQLSVGNGKAILSCDSYNEIVFFDLAEGNRFHKMYKSEIMPNERVPKHTSSIMEGDPGVLIRLLGGQITFGSFHFDDTNKLFYRVSHESNGLEGEQKKDRRYLSIFDEDLKHLQDIGDLPDDFPMDFLFIRDGKMYSFFNENDEIALPVMSVVAE